MTNRAINLDALRATVNDLADRADELLALTGGAAYPGLLEDLTGLGQDLTALGWDLAHATPALEILTRIGFRLYRRAEGLAEVSGLPAPDSQDFLPVSSVGKIHFGQRFTEPADNTPVPF